MDEISDSEHLSRLKAMAGIANKGELGTYRRLMLRFGDAATLTWAVAQAEKSVQFPEATIQNITKE